MKCLLSVAALQTKAYIAYVRKQIKEFAVIEFEFEPNVLQITVMGDFLLEDYQAFEEHINYKLRFEGVQDMLFDLRLMTHTSIDVALAEFKFSRTHARQFGKIAVVTTDQWVSWGAWLSNLFAEADLKFFDDIEDARAWLAGYSLKG